MIHKDGFVVFQPPRASACVWRGSVGVGQGIEDRVCLCARFIAWKKEAAGRLNPWEAGDVPAKHRGRQPKPSHMNKRDLIFMACFDVRFTRFGGVAVVKANCFLAHGTTFVF